MCVCVCVCVCVCICTKEIISKMYLENINILTLLVFYFILLILIFPG